MGRSKGDENEFRQQRTNEIWDAYVKIMGIYGGKVSANTIYKMVAFSPASRFFITKEWAYRVVRNFEKRNGDLDTRKRMYTEIYRRVQRMRQQDPEMSLAAAVDIVVRQPAPEMYLNTVEVMRAIKRESKRRGEERRRAFRERQERLSLMKHHD